MIQLQHMLWPKCPEKSQTKMDIRFGVKYICCQLAGLISFHLKCDSVVFCVWLWTEQVAVVMNACQPPSLPQQDLKLEHLEHLKVSESGRHLNDAATLPLILNVLQSNGPAVVERMLWGFFFCKFIYFFVTAMHVQAIWRFATSPWFEQYQSWPR